MSKYALLCLGALLFLVPCSRAAEKGMWEGYVTDSICGLKGTTQTEIAMSAHECVAEKHAKYVLYNPETKKSYVVEPQAKVFEDAGYYVMIDGTMEGDTIQMTSIRQAKAPK